MIDMNKQYTYNGKPVRIYADGSDTFSNIMHGAYLEEKGWSLRTFLEHELVEVWEPEEGVWCWFWNNKGRLLVGILKHIDNNSYIYDSPFLNTDSNVVGVDRYKAQYCAPFTGTLPEAFKGL